MGKQGAQTGGAAARVIRLVFLAGFIEGAAMHAYWLAADGIHVFRGFPLVSQVLLQLLVVLDPLAAALVWRRAPSAAPLAVAIIVADDAVNWQGNWPSVRADPALLLRPYGLSMLTVFGLFVLLTALPLRRSCLDARITRTAHEQDARTAGEAPPEQPLSAEPAG